MNYRMIKNDILKSKLTTVATMIFIAAAAMLVSLAAILTIHLTGALDTLMGQAKTPHFMQMHAGEIEPAKIDTFARQHDNVEEYQVLEFLNIDNSEIHIEGISLGGSTQDNGLSVQSESFDYLLDLDGKVINVLPGELYVPLCYRKDNTAKVGDTATIFGKKFKVAGFLRDSQMNSTLSSSKRFLVNKEDYASVQALGKTEYLIEFRLHDRAELSSFETAYTAANLPANGPMVTYQLFQTLNAFSDGMMIGLILLMSLLVVLIAFMCIRFTLLAKIEEDYREIGVMKAIGLRVSHIQRIYLSKYAAIGLLGCFTGYALSFLFQGMLMENIRTFMGESEQAEFAPIFALLGVILVFLANLVYVKGVLRTFRKISAAQAIRYGIKQEKSAGAKRICLSQNKYLSRNVFLGLKDVLSRKRLYATMLTVLILASFIMIVPLNIYHTISAKSFTTYMGIGNSDMRMDIQQSDHIPEQADEIAKTLHADDRVSTVNVLTTKSFKTDSDETIKVELGDHSVFPVTYASGKAPVNSDELALSEMNADELSKKLSDQITLVVDGIAKEFVICGIYSDITNGGKTAKAVFTEHSADAMWSVISVQLKDKQYISETVSTYANKFTFAKVSDIDNYVKQTFGQTISSVKSASNIAILTAIMITLLVTLLFMKMLIAKDRYSIAVMKAFGFTNADIMIQYAVRSIFILVLGVLIGTMLANTLGESLAGMVISSFGASSFQFMVNPVSAYILCPLMMMSSVLIATILGTTHAGNIKISENIKE